jgi:hypothetical protein
MAFLHGLSLPQCTLTVKNVFPIPIFYQLVDELIDAHWFSTLDLGTFQGAMNSTLKPLLFRYGIVFFDGILIYTKTFEDHVEHL